MGAEIVDVGVASSERLAKSDELVREHGYIVIPPYDDEQIIAGQATCGLEIIEPSRMSTSSWPLSRRRPALAA
jgi:threo-3-hydroxy-L-aspartate ammonia-lyase